MTLPPISPLAQPAIVALSALGAIGCVEHLPPAATPEPVAPAIDAAAPSPGQGRLVVDVVDGPTPVYRVRMEAERIEDNQGRVSFRLFESPELLCRASPCVADLRPGNVLLGFPVRGDGDDMEVELVHVEPRPTVYRRALSRAEGGGTLRVLGIVGTSLGGSAVVTGAALLPIGLAKDEGGLTTAGAISLGAGAVLTTLGILAIARDKRIYRPGSAIHFDL